MRCAAVLMHKLTDGEVEGLCCRGDLIKQEAASEDTLNATADASKAGNPSGAAHIKGEVRDAELEDITVKEEPIDWHQEPQTSPSSAYPIVAFKIKVENDCTEARTGYAEADELRGGSSGACNTSAVYHGPAGASQGSSDSLPSDVSGSGNGVEAAPPDRLTSRPLLCAHCDYSTGRRNFMELHLHVRHKFKFHKREVCEYDFLNSGVLKQHALAEHEGIMHKYQLREYRCVQRNPNEQHGYERNQIRLCEGEYCNGSCAKKEPLVIYKEINPGICPVFKCESCEHSTNNERQLKLHHFNKRCEVRSMKSELCDYVSKHKRRVQEQQNSKCSIDQLCTNKCYHNSSGCKKSNLCDLTSKGSKGHVFKCEFCEYSTDRVSRVKQHQAAKHEKGEMYKCEFCEFSSGYKQTLMVHQAVKHGKGELFKCDLCQYSSGYKTNLRKHIATKHGRGQVFKCEFCEYCSGRPKNVQRHQAAKHGEGQLFKCELCEFTSGYEKTVSVHEATMHGKGKLFRCEFCDYSSGYKQNIRSHLATKHSIGQIFKCQFCKYSSGYKRTVKEHQITKHGKGQGFNCELCEYSSNQKQLLRTHLATKHGKGQLFRCEFCDYSSGYKMNVRAHQATKHGKGQLFKCEFCGYSSGQMRNFRRHQATKHK